MEKNKPRKKKIPETPKESLFPDNLLEDARKLILPPPEKKKGKTWADDLNWFGD